MSASAKEHGRVPWYLWPLVPFALLSAMIVIIPLAALACFSIPYFSIYPDRHRHVYDENGTTRQQELLARWRACYNRLGFRERVARAIKLRRRGRKKACRIRTIRIRTES